MVTLEFIPRDGSGDTLTIGDEAIASLNATATNTGVGTWRATLKGDRRLEDRASRQDRVNVITDDTKFAGIITNCSHTRSSGDTQISGKGIAKLLQENRPDNRPVVYDNVFAGDAIEDYWSRTQFSNVTVTKQTGDVVVSDSLTQSADTTSEWENELESIGDTTPLFIENDSLKLAQTGFVNDLSGASNVDMSGGEGQNFQQGAGSNNTISITLDYETSNLNFYARLVDTSGTDEFIALRVIESGSVVGSTISPPSTLGWKNTGTINKTYTPGSYTFTFETDPNLNSSGSAKVDLIAVVDDRYAKDVSNLDNTVDEDNGYLDDPALYPTDANPVVTTNPTETTRNIASATVDVVANDTSNDQRLGLSDDGGTNFQRGDNTRSFTASFTDAGRELVTEFRLSGITGTERDATPQFNYQGQTIDSFETKVDLDDRVVLIGFEVSKNNFENLQKLHSSSDFVFTIDHDSSDAATMPVFSFPRGVEVRSSEVINDREIDETPEVDGAQFYNTIPLEGGLDSNGDRPFAEVDNQDSIDEVGDEISPGLLRDPTISSDIEAGFIAQALLDKALKNGELRGQKTVPPTLNPTPGFSYAVSWLDDDPTELTLEEVSVQKSTGDAQTTLDFTGRQGFARDIDELRRNAREQSDEI